jgi:phage FluMu protein Com
MGRYQAEPLRRYDFMHEFEVHCPKCTGHAYIKVPHFRMLTQAALTCSACFFTEDMAARVRFKPSGRVKCSHCDTFLVLEMEGQKSIPSYVAVKCPKCLQQTKVSEHWEKYILKYHEGGNLDPAFGLELWFQAIVKKQVIWAYNKQHLEAIRTYVEATLRERTTDRFKMTMVEKLPNFIKYAKNRGEVLKVIDRMLAK